MDAEVIILFLVKYVRAVKHSRILDRASYFTSLAVIQLDRRRVTAAMSPGVLDDFMHDQAAAYQPSRQAYSRAAPRYNIPPRALVSVEHICVVENVERAIETLGGAAQLQQVGPSELYSSWQRR